jgi:hypothetical protein
LPSSTGPCRNPGAGFAVITLNDGAPNGTRLLNGSEVPVFDQLSVWQDSGYATYQVEAQVSGEPALQALIDLSHDRQIGIEDWSTVRRICDQCSHGNPGPYRAKAAESQPSSLQELAFAAKSQDELLDMLGGWTLPQPGLRLWRAARAPGCELIPDGIHFSLDTRPRPPA